MSKKGSKFKKYSPEFKISVILDMRENHLGYRETVRKYWRTSNRQEEELYRSQVKKWERIYLKEGEAGFYTERRGRMRKVDNPKIGRPKKKSLDKKVGEDDGVKSASDSSSESSSASSGGVDLPIINF